MKLDVLIRSLALLVMALAVLCVIFVGPRSNVVAAPQEQQAIDQVWFDQSIATAGTTAIISSGTAGKWTALIHVDAPAAADSITVTVGGRAVIGTTIYTSTETTTWSSHDFAVAQNKIISGTYSNGERWPQLYVTANGRNAALTADMMVLLAP